MTDKILLSGEYEWLSLRKKTFTTKDGEEINSIWGTLEIDGNIPNGKYYVNIYKNKEKKNDKSPDYTLYLKPVIEQDTVKPTANDDDF
jgi:hypothetical protein